VTQLPSATGLDGTLNRTFTDLICNAHRRTNGAFRSSDSFRNVAIPTRQALGRELRISTF
ncbi:MAG: hypothetical protein LHW46_08505, partial [Candidatus Cloacimonetes bacterium]|nr:hypothetical protein [Candidatus Cloacimonadota bacterium]